MNSNGVKFYQLREYHHWQWDNELQALQVLANFRAEPEPSSLRLAWIRNTSRLDELWASEALLAEARANPQVEILDPPARLRFDADLGLVKPGAVHAAA